MHVYFYISPSLALVHRLLYHQKTQVMIAKKPSKRPKTISRVLPATIAEWGCALSLLLVAVLAVGVVVSVWRFALGM